MTAGTSLHPRITFEFEKTDNIGGVEGADGNGVVSAQRIQNVYIAAVTTIDHCTTCVNCNSKIENPIPTNTDPQTLT